MFDGIKRIYIATDQDTKGIELKSELIRRLGPERCYIVSFKDCKDANEFLLKYGPEIKEVIPNAIPVPVKGIIEANNIYADIRDLYERGVQSGEIIGQKIIENQKQTQQEYVTNLTKHLIAEAEQLSSKLPEYGNKDTVDAARQKLFGYLEKSYGYTPQDLSQVMDHRLIVLAHKAMLYDSQTKEGAEVKKILKKLPKVMKPGTTSVKKGPTEESKQKTIRFKKTGKTRDLANVLMDRI